MDAVEHQVGVGRVQVQLDLGPLLVQAHGHVFDHVLHQIVHVQRLHVQPHGPRFGQAGAQHVFHEDAQTLVLLTDEAEVVLLGVVVERGVRQRFAGQANAADGGFEFVGEVVDQVALQPVQPFGPLNCQQGVGEDGGDQQHHDDAEGEGAEHLAHQVAGEPGEMHPELEGAQRDAVPGARGQELVLEVLSIFGQEHRLSVAVEGAKHRHRVDALFLQGDGQQGIHREGLHPAHHHAFLGGEFVGAQKVAVVRPDLVQVPGREPRRHDLEALLHTLVEDLLAKFGRRLQPVHLDGDHHEHRHGHGAHQPGYETACHASKFGRSAVNRCADAPGSRHVANKHSQPPCVSHARR